MEPNNEPLLEPCAAWTYLSAGQFTPAQFRARHPGVPVVEAVLDYVYGPSGVGDGFIEGNPFLDAVIAGAVYALEIDE